MANISNVNVMLTMNASGFSAGVAKAERDMERLRASIAHGITPDAGGGRQTFDSIRAQIARELGASGSGEMLAFRREQAASTARQMGAGIDPASMGYFQTTAEHIRVATARSEQWNMSLKGVAKAGGLAAAGIAGAGIATKLLSGGFADAAEEIKKLPFGVGALATALEGVLGTWTGIADEIATANSRAAIMTSTFETMRDVSKQIRDYRQETAEIEADIDRKRRLAGAQTPEERAAIAGESAAAEETRRGEAQIKQLQAKRAELMKQRQEASKAGTDFETNRMPDRLRSLLYAPLEFGMGPTYKKTKQATDIARSAAYQIKADVDRQIDETYKAEKKLRDEIERRAKIQKDAASGSEMDAARKEQAKASERATEDGQKAIDARARAQNDAFRQERNAIEETQRLRLKAQGRTLDAELMAIRHSYQKRIEEARTAGEREALAESMGLELAIASRAGVTRLGRSSAAEVFAGRDIEAAGGGGRGPSGVVPIKGDPEQTKYLRGMYEQIKRGLPARAGR